MSLAKVRKEYRDTPLREARTPADPMALFARWMKRALGAGMLEPTAMSLATADARGRPSVRFVLLKGADERGFTFFTNLQSRKGRELEATPHGALALWWPPLEQQVRIEGRIAPVSEAEADEYFALRPRAARIGAWASPQSRSIADRATLERRLVRVTASFEGREVPRPPHWGGYRLRPARIEFWQGRTDRLHDRILYTRARSGWKRSRLAP